MRGMSLIDAVIILAVVALLLFLSSKDFGRYEGRTLSPPPPATVTPGP
jgi:hypothetical protein